jgi:hypothetical protein
MIFERFFDQQGAFPSQPRANSLRKNTKNPAASIETNDQYRGLMRLRRLPARSLFEEKNLLGCRLFSAQLSALNFAKHPVPSCV